MRGRRRVVPDGSGLGRPGLRTASGKDSITTRSRAGGIVLVSRRARLRELMARVQARLCRRRALAGHTVKVVMAATFSLAHSVGTLQRRGRLRVHRAMAAITAGMAVDVRHSPLRVIALRRLRTTVRPLSRITARRPRMAAVRLAVVRRVAAVVAARTAAVAVGTPLQAATEAAEGHDPSLSRSGSP
jgi:hypothetical protein